MTSTKGLEMRHHCDEPDKFGRNLLQGRLSVAQGLIVPGTGTQSHLTRLGSDWSRLGWARAAIAQVYPPPSKESMLPRQ